MFTCSICNETFIGIHQGSTFTTQCGHVFHHQCVMTWLERSQTCPHCRSPVSENKLVKLFLQFDPNAQVSWDRKTDEEINKLKEQLKALKEKESHHASSIYDLQLQLNLASTASKKSKEFIDKLQNEFENQIKKNCEIAANLKVINEEYNALETEKKQLKLKYLEQKTEVQSLQKNLYNLQSANSVIIDKLKSEIADLKSEKVNFQSRRDNVENTDIDQPCTSKMSIETENAILLQKTKTEYYGHDPCLIISAKQFLSGCVFLIIELHVEHESKMCNDITKSKLDIIAHGGLVEQLYSDRITHIICLTQKHHIVEQGIKDGKRCVTDFWLRDIITRKKMIPPWLAHHFPLPYSINNHLPCKNFKIAIVNFDLNEYYRIKTMIELVSGVITEEITNADIIVSMKLEGELVEKSIIDRVVNVQWINDVFFGKKIDLNKPGCLKYKQFDLCNPFIVNYDMVSHLMEAWKTPLFFYKRVYDLTSSPDHSTQFKKQKSISENSKSINLIDDEVNDNDVVITYIKTTPKSKPSVMFSGFSTGDKEILKMMLHLVGGTVASNLFQPTHLVMNKPKTSLEFFICLPTVRYVVNENWLRDSHTDLRFLDERAYLIQNLQDKHMGLCNVPAILDNYKRHQLFRRLSFFITPGITYPPVHRLEEIISSAGGIVEKTRRSLKSIQETPAFSYFIISCPEDHYLCNDLSDIHNVVYLPEFITCSLLAQKILTHKFTMDMTAQN
uniref:PAX-interacting protein 1 n=1 Tax=Melanaphis sacchari TaxID=742174 RepID=A0A2H8TDD8_9HEMI